MRPIPPRHHTRFDPSRPYDRHDRTSPDRGTVGYEMELALARTPGSGSFSWQGWLMSWESFQLPDSMATRAGNLATWLSDALDVGGKQFRGRGQRGYLSLLDRPRVSWASGCR